MLLLNGDCLELMKTLENDSIDLIFCDLPYVDSKGKGQTSCKWNQSAIDLEKFWIQVMRIKKLHTPIFMTTTTKFGVELINSAPKKCFFRYDVCWKKSNAVGHLSSSKMPLRIHEMIYVFYEKLPFYDLSSHTHKFIKERDSAQKNGKIYEGQGDKKIMEGKYDPPLPVSVISDAGEEKQIIKGYHNTYNTEGRKKPIVREKGGKYDPPLPNSMLEIKSTRGKHHSTEKPVALMEWVLKYYSKEGDVILDPTMGSGSTGVACKNMNREFIGIEMDEEIFKVAEGRLI